MRKWLSFSITPHTIFSIFLVVLLRSLVETKSIMMGISPLVFIKAIIYICQPTEPTRKTFGHIFIDLKKNTNYSDVEQKAQTIQNGRIELID